MGSGTRVKKHVLAAGEAPAETKAMRNGHAPHHANGDQRRRLSNPDLYINREVSSVAFIRRVLEEAQSERHPLLERVKFLSFVGIQTDEFVMVRIAGLDDQLEAQVTDSGPDGMQPAQQLAALRPLIERLFRDQQHCLQSDLIPKLA